LAVKVIVAGRSYDPAPYAGLCQLHGIDPGVYLHMGKIVECGANCAEPKGRVILATIRKDSFDLEPMNPADRCTPAVNSLTLSWMPLWYYVQRCRRTRSWCCASL